ncbi:pantetheine-phosphate adenylyltransferase [Phosphitispora sp. TUW77]|uniref:pantetheine-phosphate adenylyltransferase n=1 Tax=Phosphitispora sp. TUW77 TaxID=3152361 RepID=UPI003AB4676A
MKIAIYPGSFDPVTNGHIDIIERAAALFKHVIVSVSINSGKTPMFTLEERVELLTESLKSYSNVSVDSFKGLTVNYAVEKNAQVIIRGLRAISDFESEFQMALTNKKLQPDIETVFMMSQAQWLFLSSSVVKEVVSLGGSIGDFVPNIVEQALKNKFNSTKRENAFPG